jgi:hypothetical protein
MLNLSWDATQLCNTRGLKKLLLTRTGLFLFWNLLKKTRIKVPFIFKFQKNWNWLLESWGWIRYAGGYWRLNDCEKDETTTTGVEQMPIIFVNKLRQLAKLSEKLEETCMHETFYPVLWGSPYLVGSGPSSHFLWVDMF